jgi:hypothetical protein
LDDYWVFERGSGEREVLDGGVEGSDVFADIEKSVGNAESDCDVREKKRTDLGAGFAPAVGCRDKEVVAVLSSDKNNISLNFTTNRESTLLRSFS